MLNFLRILMAVLSFAFGAYLLVDLFINGFNWLILIFALLAFFAAHYLWPKGEEIDSSALELIGYIIDLPFRAIALTLRGVISIGKSADDVGGSG